MNELPAGRAAPEPRLRRVFVLFSAASLAYGIAVGIAALLVYRAYLADIAGSYLAPPYAQAIGWGAIKPWPIAWLIHAKASSAIQPCGLPGNRVSPDTSVAASKRTQVTVLE